MFFNRFYGKKIKTFLILVLVLCVFTSCSVKKRSKNNNNNSINASAVQGEVPSHSMTGVVTNIDTDLKQVTIRELDCDVDSILDYNATSVVIDKYGSEITGDELQPGQIMEVTYNTSNADIIKMHVPKDVWEYQEVDKFSFDGDTNALSIAGKKYQYTSWTYFSSLERKIQLAELGSHDVITVRGIGITVYSVTRTKGHGYIRLENYDTFKGGTISVGNNIVLPITDNMLVTAGVGSYRVTLSKRKVKAVKNVIIKDGKETILDFSDYKEEVKNVGTIKFNIEPHGADLYINNSNVDYSSPVTLNYGEYNIRVEMTGYTAYTGVLDVEKPGSTINIDLIEKDASVSSASTATPSPTKKADDKVTTKKIDSNHTITVSAPDGAEVYLDNVYKGLAPCTFTKVIGSQTITLSKPGHITKSYSVDILDDDKNVKLSFSELMEDSD